jgi:hypothetical protein
MALATDLLHAIQIIVATYVIAQVTFTGAGLVFSAIGRAG